MKKLSVLKMAVAAIALSASVSMAQDVGININRDIFHSQINVYGILM